MPSNFNFYVNKSSEKSVLVIDQPTYKVTQGSATVLGSQTDSNVIGSVLFTKTWNQDASGSSQASFEWKIVFNNNTSLPQNSILNLNFEFKDQTTGSNNPTETIPSGSTSVTVTGAVQNLASSGEFINQPGYCNKTKSSSSSYRLYEVYFPQAVVTYTNVFNNYP